MAEVRCEVIEGTEQTKLLVMAIENLQRKDLTIVEEGEIYDQLSTAWTNCRELSVKLGVSKSRVNFAINAYLKLSPEVQQMVQSKEIDEKSTRALTKLYKEPVLQLAVAQRLAKEETKQFDKAKEIIEFVNDKKTPEYIKEKLVSDETYTLEEAKEDAKFDIYDTNEQTPADKTYAKFIQTLDALDGIITPINLSSFRAIDNIGVKERLKAHLAHVQMILSQIDIL